VAASKPKYVFSQGKTIPMWRGHLALVLCRRQDAGGTQGRDGLATNDNRDEAATTRGDIFPYIIIIRTKLESKMPIEYNAWFIW